MIMNGQFGNLDNKIYYNKENLGRREEINKFPIMVAIAPVRANGSVRVVIDREINNKTCLHNSDDN